MNGELTHWINLDKTAPSRARALVQPLRSSVDDGCFEAIRQVVTELVAQCVQDAGVDDQVEVSIRAAEVGLVEVAVSRPSRRTEPAEQSAADDAARIAFRLVDQLVDEWGVREDDKWVTVWLHLRDTAYLLQP